MDEEQYQYVKNRCDEEEVNVMFQVGSRNMQNFSLLRTLNESDNLVLLKRGFGNTVDELVYARNYMPKAMVYGCERGIRTFSDSSRFTLDLATIPKIHQEANMIPVIVDPSHAAGIKSYVEYLLKGIKKDSLINDVVYLSGSKNDETAEIALLWSTAYDNKILSFANTLHTQNISILYLFVFAYIKQTLPIIIINTRGRVAMIRGVNKKIIEVKNTGNDYFERAILFVREQKKDISQEMLDMAS